MKVGDLVRKHRNVHASREPWWSHGLLAIGVILPKGPYCSNTDFTVLWCGRYRTYEQKKNLEVVQERK